MKEKPKLVLKSVNEATVAKKTSVRQIFGVSRDSQSDVKGIEAKMGNTTAKMADETRMTDEDATQLPAPTESYLVTSMPQVLSEIRPSYPKEAKEKQKEGAVVLDILIDDKGEVRDVKLVDGEAIFVDEAILAIKKFKFRPALLDGNAVAVRIQYTIRFRLDY